MEYVPRGDLHSVLHSGLDATAFTWSDPLLKLALDAGQGMVYLHSQKVMHRDLKSTNLLVSATFGCKVSDFGLSKRRVSWTKAYSSVIGTPYWIGKSNVVTICVIEGVSLKGCH